MTANHTSGRALWGNVLEDMAAAASKRLALINFGHFAQLCGHWAHKDILIPAAVLVEFLNILGRKAGHAAALAAVTELTPPFLVISEPENIPLALEKFSEVPAGVSFTDCLVMAVADEYGTVDIFGFDKQFAD